MFVVLHSDFNDSHYVSEMIGTVYKIYPDARVITGIQDLPVFSPAAAGIIFRSVVDSFPSPAIHVVVVDPSVGTTRREIVVELDDGSSLIGPDNGVLYPAATSRGIKSIWHIKKLSALLPHRTCETFHGRDIFAPAAALIASGTDPSEFCVSTDTMVESGCDYRIGDGSISGEVIYIDRFGNCITNIPSDTLEAASLKFGDMVKVEVGRNIVNAIVAMSYSGVKGLIVIPSSHGTLELAMDRKSAADHYFIKTGQDVIIRPV